MISEIRIKARASSMEEAEREIELLLDHARMVGYLEGIVPQSSSDLESHYGPVPGRDDWAVLGMPYEGRGGCKFYAEQDPLGGLKEFGFEVIEVDDFTPHGLHGVEGSEAEPVRRDVTEKVMVLHRRRPVTRDTSLGFERGDDSPPSEEEQAEHIRKEMAARLGVDPEHPRVVLALAAGEDSEMVQSYAVRPKATG